MSEADRPHLTVPCRTPEDLERLGALLAPSELAEAVVAWREDRAEAEKWRDVLAYIIRRLFGPPKSAPQAPAPLSPPAPAACAPRSLVGQRGAILAGDAEPQARWAGVQEREVRDE